MKKVILLSILTLWGVFLGAVCSSNPDDQTTQPLNVLNETNSNQTNEELDQTNQSVNEEVSAPEAEPADSRFFTTQELGDIDDHLQFSAYIPVGWKVEYVPDVQAINFYDPAASGESTLEQSEIFVRYFEASTFLTLQTVTIHSREELEINGRPAVKYDIEKKSGVANFVSQPTWRSERHQVTDIRQTDDSPTTFFVFARRPTLSTQVFEELLQSVNFERLTPLSLPMDGFVEQATLKTFGTYITPATSPVQPERFSGYHTGVDVETTPTQQSQDIPVYAIAPGTLSVKQTSDGYGGVVIITHQIDGETYSAVYGHLDIQSVSLHVGEQVETGQQIGHLGEGGSAETDGERTHLHFGLMPGSSTKLLGYVTNQDQLSGWIDPLQFFRDKGLIE